MGNFYHEWAAMSHWKSFHKSWLFATNVANKFDEEGKCHLKHKQWSFKTILDASAAQDCSNKQANIS